MMRRLAVLIAACLVWAAGTWSIVLAAERITAQEAFDLLAAEEIVLVDIRRPIEWHKTGTPEGATLVSMHRDGGIEAFISEIDTRIGREKPIALICAGGVRSRYLQWRLGQYGFGNAIDVMDGVVGGSLGKGWIGRGLPMRAYVRKSRSELHQQGGLAIGTAAE